MPKPEKKRAQPHNHEHDSQNVGICLRKTSRGTQGLSSCVQFEVHGRPLHSATNLRSAGLDGTKSQRLVYGSARAVGGTIESQSAVNDDLSNSTRPAIYIGGADLPIATEPTWEAAFEGSVLDIPAIAGAYLALVRPYSPQNFIYNTELVPCPTDANLNIAGRNITNRFFMHLGLLLRNLAILDAEDPVGDWKLLSGRGNVKIDFVHSAENLFATLRIAIELRKAAVRHDDPSESPEALSNLLYHRELENVALAAWSMWHAIAFVTKASGAEWFARGEVSELSGRVWRAMDFLGWRQGGPLFEYMKGVDQRVWGCVAEAKRNDPDIEVEVRRQVIWMGIVDRQALAGAVLKGLAGIEKYLFYQEPTRAER